MTKSDIVRSNFDENTAKRNPLTQACKFVCGELYLFHRIMFSMDKKILRNPEKLLLRVKFLRTMEKYSRTTILCSWTIKERKNYL